MYIYIYTYHILYTYAWLIQTLMQRVPTHRYNRDRFPCACPHKYIYIYIFIHVKESQWLDPKSIYLMQLQQISRLASLKLTFSHLYVWNTIVSFWDGHHLHSRYGLTTEQAQNVEIAATTSFGAVKTCGLTWGKVRVDPKGVGHGGILVMEFFLQDAKRYS